MDSVEYKIGDWIRTKWGCNGVTQYGSYQVIDVDPFRETVSFRDDDGHVRTWKFHCVNKLPEASKVAETEPKETVLSTQVGGDHYKSMGIQPVDYIHANNLDYFEGNIVKYITRHRAKGGRRDIEKLIHYAQMILEREYND